MPSTCTRRASFVCAHLNGVNSLTAQPILPKLRLIKHMHQDATRLRTLALFLAIIFIAGQLHFCADLSAAPASSHLCPVCSAAASVIVAQSPAITLMPASNRLESIVPRLSDSTDIYRSISPRAPPSPALSH